MSRLVFEGAVRKGGVKHIQGLWLWDAQHNIAPALAQKNQITQALRYLHSDVSFVDSSSCTACSPECALQGSKRGMQC